MKSILRGILAVSLIGQAFCAPATAEETVCGGLADMLGAVAAGYGEAIVWEGDVRPALRMIVTANPDGTTWTAFVVEGDRACILGAGTERSGLVLPPGKEI